MQIASYTLYMYYKWINAYYRNYAEVLCTYVAADATSVIVEQEF